MSFLPNSTKPIRNRPAKTPKVKKSPLEKLVFNLCGGAVVAMFCVAVTYQMIAAGASAVFSPALSQALLRANAVPVALTAAENALKQWGCTPLTGWRLEAQRLPPGALRDPSAPMAIALTGVCKGQILTMVAYQSQAGEISLSEPRFAAVSTIKLGADGFIRVNATLPGEARSRLFEIYPENGRLNIP